MRSLQAQSTVPLQPSCEGEELAPGHLPVLTTVDRRRSLEADFLCLGHDLLPVEKRWQRTAAAQQEVEACEEAVATDRLALRCRVVAPQAHHRLSLGFLVRGVIDHQESRSPRSSWDVPPAWGEMPAGAYGLPRREGSTDSGNTAARFVLAVSSTRELWQRARKRRSSLWRLRLGATDHAASAGSARWHFSDVSVVWTSREVEPAGRTVPLPPLWIEPLGRKIFRPLRGRVEYSPTVHWGAYRPPSCQTSIGIFFYTMRNYSGNRSLSSHC